jgi:hypothetical protein
MVAKKKKKEKKKEKKKDKKEKILRTVFVRAIEAFEVKQHEAKRKKHRIIFGVCRADIN